MDFAGAAWFQAVLCSDHYFLCLGVDLFQFFHFPHVFMITEVSHIIFYTISFLRIACSSWNTQNKMYLFIFEADFRLCISHAYAK